MATDVSQVELDRLAQKQEIILSELEQLELRVNNLMQKRGVPPPKSLNSLMKDDLTIITSHKSASELNERPSTRSTHRGRSHSHHSHKQSISKQMFKQQEEQFDRLLNVACSLEQMEHLNNYKFDQESRDTINQSLQAMIGIIDSRLTKTTSKAQFLLEMAKQSTETRPESTPDSVRSTGTPVFHARIRKLSSAGLEPMQILPFHNEPKETESEEYTRRMNELEYSINHFKQMLSDFDKTKNGFVNAKDVYNVLSNMNLELDLKQAMHSRPITIIIKLMTDNNNEKVNYNQLCDLTLDINKTDRGDDKHEWHHFRRTLIGMERKDGCLRIRYRFDGWPYPQTIRLFHSLDTSHDIVMANDIGVMIHNATKEHIEFEKIAYAEKSKHNTGKTTWVKIDKTEAIPLHVERDGWLEADVWLKTQSFLEHKLGRPLPKYA